MYQRDRSPPKGKDTYIGGGRRFLKDRMVPEPVLPASTRPAGAPSSRERSDSMQDYGAGAGGRGGHGYSASIVKPDRTERLYGSLLREAPLPPQESLTVRTSTTGGTLGKGIKVGVNWFPMVFDPTRVFYSYAVSINPEVKQLWKSIAIVNSCGKIHGETHFGVDNHPVFDGRSRLYSTKVLEMESLGQNTLTVSLEGFDFEVSFVRKGDVSLEALRHLSANVDIREPLQAIETFINGSIVAAGDKYFSSARIKFPIPEKGIGINLGGLATIWKGFLCSSYITSGYGLTLNMDVSCCAFYKHLPLTVAMDLILGSEKTKSPLQPRHLEALSQELRGVKIVVTHLPYTRAFSIQSFIRETPKEKRFDITENNVTSTTDVESYFFDKYTYKLKIPWLPCVRVGSNKESFFPVEVCLLAPSQKMSRKAMVFEQESFMIKQCALKPQARKAEVQSLFAGRQYSADKFLEDASVVMKDVMIESDARILSAPTLLYQFDAPISIPPAVGSWNMRGRRLRQPGDLVSWAVIVMGSVDMELLKISVIALGEMMIKMGLKVNQQRPTLISQLEREKFVETYERTVKQAGIDNAARPQFALVILENQSKDTYAEVKYVSDVLVGVPSQCVIKRNFVGFRDKGPNDQYLANLCLKINAKIGGMNVSILGTDAPASTKEKALLPFPKCFGDQAVMFLGATTSHAGSGEDSPTITALVGSLDKHSGVYSSSFRFQIAREDIMIKLDEMMIEILKKRMEREQPLPAIIIYFREGVAESAYSHVLSTEIGLLKLACSKHVPGWKPQFIASIVSRRHHTRMFPVKKDDEDRSTNSVAGTVIDGSVCDPRFFEFYLLSHAGVQGTSRPTKYTVIHDELNVSPDEFQLLCYHICTRSVSIPPASFYANIVINRAKVLVSGSINSRSLLAIKEHSLIKDSMYFV